MKQKIVVLSADAMVYEDLAYLKTLPNYKKYLSQGALIKSVRTIYPTVTYPAHVSMASGTRPAKHGVPGNYELHPGNLAPPWYWFHDAVKTTDIFDAARKARLSTASVFWPVTGNHPSIDYLIDEYWTQGPSDTIKAAFARSGSKPEMLEIISRYSSNIKERVHPSMDYLVIGCACDIIKQYKPDLLMIHPANIDGARHEYGLFNEKINKAIEDTDRWIGELMEALDYAGVREETNFFLVSDHGQLDITRVINLNVMLADKGLIRSDSKGNFSGWDAYCLSNGMSALVYLKEPDSPKVYTKTRDLLLHLCNEGIYGISRVFTEPEIRAQEGLGGSFSFVLETDGYTSFGDDWKRPIVKNFDASDYRYGRATHGYLPDKGPQPLLAARGPGIRDGVVLEKGRIIDEAPTYAKLLGLELPDAEGEAIGEILA
ncbi:MAG: ectonucleotide pyrophosphatase/phosphodiesterase [Treponema sp.]|jgi:predicted AlkP superfamily pyrophosphatase or phosphodiesterase|nr:ectonucleotide pyrophosphatase/phosphodiesterase [Treponema sp.]